MNKRGQYYLVAAIIFLGIFFSLMSVINQSKKETPTRIYEISKELKRESSKVIEYSTNREDNKIDNFTEKYSEYAGENMNIYFITGNSTIQEVYNYTEGIKNPLFFTPLENGILNATIEGKIYSFDFEEGESFYFLITQETKGEKYILRG